MNDIITLKISKISRAFIIGFLAMMIFTFLFSNTENNYYNLYFSDIDNLYWQLSIFLGVSIIILFLNKFFDKTLLSLLICMLLLVFLFLFSINSPAYSLLIGAFVLAIPTIYFSIKEIIRVKGHLLSYKFIIPLINIMIFLAIIVLLIIKANYIYPLFDGINNTGINNDLILYGNRSNFLLYGLITSFFLIIIYFFADKEESKIRKWVKIIINVLIISLVSYEVIHLSYIMVARVKSLYVPTFDFGLFTQMFYNMKNFNGMVTTLERSVLLSHLSVHISPIYYLILPFFMIFPYPETLQIAQVIIVALGVIPLMLIGKEFKFSSFLILILVSIYMFHPAIIGSSFYDLHENCFLAPLLLFVIYFMIKQKGLLLAIFIVLTLLVKEDSFFYLIFIGLFFITGYSFRISDSKQRRKNLILGIMIILVAGTYFIFANYYLNITGDGAMFWRYRNLNAYPDLGTLGIIITVFQNPSYLLSTMFTPDKIYHLLIVLLMLGMIPLFAKSIFDYLLFVPLIVFNFATSYGYQHQFGFQYYYGSVTILIFMLMLVIRDKMADESESGKILKLKYFKFNNFLYLLPLLIITFAGYKYLDTRTYSINVYKDTIERNNIMKDLLKSIPDDKAVLATGYLTTYLADREILFDIQYYDLDESELIFDYIMIDQRVNPDRIIEYENNIVSNGYELSDLSNDYINVFIPKE